MTWKRAHVWALVATLGLLMAACTSTADYPGAAVAGRQPRPARAKVVDACELIEPEAVAQVAGLEVGAFMPGERYPGTGTCVWWSVAPFYSVTLTLETPPGGSTWPCDKGPDSIASRHGSIVAVVCVYERGPSRYLPAPSRRVAHFAHQALR
jgi:hypothetical protein